MNLTSRVVDAIANLRLALDADMHLMMEETEEGEDVEYEDIIFTVFDNGSWGVLKEAIPDTVQRIMQKQKG